MKLVILSSLVISSILPIVTSNNTTAPPATVKKEAPEKLNIFSQANEEEKMLAVIFRAQDFCRAELKDFDFDVHFDIVSATVYFSGTNFTRLETGYITSNSLKPIHKLMDRCAPGTMEVFDNVKAIGPDKTVRTIKGTSYILK